MVRNFLFCLLVLTSTLLLPGEKLITLGALDSDAPLYMPTQLEEGPDGNIYVFDAKDAFIKVYSSEGKCLRKMAGKGEGPGKFKRFGEFGFTHDNRLFFTEMPDGHKWITLLHLSGELDKVIKLNIDGDFGVWKAIALPDNRFLAGIEKFGTFKKQGKFYCHTYPIQLAIINSHGKTEQVLIAKDNVFSISYGPSTSTKRIPFFPDFLWGLNVKDGTIAFSEGNSNILSFYNLKGELVKERNTTLPNAPDVTSDDLDAWREDIKKNLFSKLGSEKFNSVCGMIYDYKESIYKKKPFLCDLAITNEGNIFLKGCQEDEENPIRKYWLLDKEGKELCQFTSTATLIGISAHFVYCVIGDGDGNPRALVMKKSGVEKEDLSRLVQELEVRNQGAVE